MNSYQEIQQLLQQKDFQSALLVIFSNNLKLKLTSKINNQQESSSIETNIDLLKGITTKTSDYSNLDSQSNLMKFHSRQLEKIYELWDTNRESLIAILKVLAGNNNVNITNLKTSFSASNLNVNTSETHTENSNNNVSNIVDLMLEENQNYDDVNTQNTHNWVDETDNLTNENQEDKEIIPTAEQQKIAQESWNEFMDDLSAEEEAVSEEVIVDDVSSDEEIDDDWSEWLNDDENQGETGEKIDWSQEDWQEEEVIGNR